MASLNDGFFPEVWFVSWHNYLDQTNGASISTRSLLLAMRKYGWNVETFCGTTTIIGSAGANVHTSDPGRVVPYSSS